MIEDLDLTYFPSAESNQSLASRTRSKNHDQSAIENTKTSLDGKPSKNGQHSSLTSGFKNLLHLFLLSDNPVTNKT